MRCGSRVGGPIPLSTSHPPSPLAARSLPRLAAGGRRARPRLGAGDVRRCASYHQPPSHLREEGWRDESDVR
eukprot:995601-Prymnesium_polylepis.1